MAVRVLLHIFAEDELIDERPEAEPALAADPQQVVAHLDVVVGGVEVGRLRAQVLVHRGEDFGAELARARLAELLRPLLELRDADDAPLAARLLLALLLL